MRGDRQCQQVGSLERKGIGDEIRGGLGSPQFRGPEWELLVYTPAVFVRVANAGLTGCGTWKSVRKMGGRLEMLVKPHPLFFVSVASKGFSPTVSLLFATLVEGTISVAAKGLTGLDCWRESDWEGWEDLGGVRRTTGGANMVCGGASFAEATPGRRKNLANLTTPLYHIGTVCQ
jgi:hypothetical protein